MGTKVNEKLEFSFDLLSFIMEIRSSNNVKLPQPFNTIGIPLVFELIGKIASLGLKQDDPELFNLCNRLGFYNPQHWNDSTNEGIRELFEERGFRYPYPIESKVK